MFWISAQRSLKRNSWNLGKSYSLWKKSKLGLRELKRAGRVKALQVSTVGERTENDVMDIDVTRSATGSSTAKKTRIEVASDIT
uniref:Uncharacterized protein n=1 Tax=Physcomitrium patens TaxID=3218 RepID=A0A2K1JVK0_PHYPA|nr:hypothetical protein PHYPA_015330 [Physcomitrium patens]